MSNNSAFTFSPTGPQHPIFSPASTPNTSTSASIDPRIPTVGSRARDLHYSIRDFLSTHPLLELGGQEHFSVERRRHQDVFGLHALPMDKIHPIDDVEFTAIRGVHPEKVVGGGDSAGGNMTAAICLRRMDEGRKPLAGQILLYPEARLPFDTPAATENNSGLYLECIGIFGFASNYLPRSEDISPQDRYVSPGMQSVEDLRDQPPAAVFTSGYDPLRDVGCEYASKLSQAGVPTRWRHYDNLTHGWLQLTAWSEVAEQAVKDVAHEVKRLVFAAIDTHTLKGSQGQLTSDRLNVRDLTSANSQRGQTGDRPTTRAARTTRVSPFKINRHSKPTNFLD